MRLIVATSSYPTRTDEAVNAGVFVRSIAAELIAQGHSVHVLTPDKGEPVTGSPAPVHTFRWGGTEKVLTRLDPRRPSDFLRLGRTVLVGRLALRRLIAKVQADAVLAMWAVPAGYWASGSNRPYVVWVLGSDIWGAGKYPLGRSIVRGVLLRAGHIFSDGLKLGEDVKRLTGRASEFLPSCRQLPVQSTPPAWLSKDRAQFLFIGRWDRVKGVDTLLDAMDILSGRMPGVHLHLFGGGPLEAEVHGRAGQGRLRECVTVHGYADPVTAAAYLKACDALVISSRIESIPLVYSDALQCACPVVSTNVGDLGRLICQQGTGGVCPPDSPNELAEAMWTMAAEGPGLRARYAEALSRAAAMFNPGRSAARCAEVLADLGRCA